MQKKLISVIVKHRVIMTQLKESAMQTVKFIRDLNFLVLKSLTVLAVVTHSHQVLSMVL